eukprot:2048665-Amphidinium_carterae.1
MGIAIVIIPVATRSLEPKALLIAQGIAAQTFGNPRACTQVSTCQPMGSGCTIPITFIPTKMIFSFLLEVKWRFHVERASITWGSAPPHQEPLTSS